MHFRIWEFCLGGVLIFIYKYRNLIFFRKIIVFFSIFFIFIFLAYFHQIDDPIKNYHPGLLTLPIIFPTALIIIYGSNISLLKNRFIIYFGKISYSFYIWHFILIYLVKSFFIINNVLIFSFFTFTLSLFISLFSFHFIENYFRYASLKSIRHFTLLVIMTISISYSIFVIHEKGEIGYGGHELKSLYIDDDYNIPLLHKNWGDLLESTDVFTKKNHWKDYSPKFNSNGNKNILIVGDSHSVGLFNAFKDLKLQGYTFSRYGANIFNFDDNSNFLNWFFESEIFHKADYILLKSRWEVDDIKNLEKLKDKIISYNKKLVIFNRRPEFPLLYSYKFQYGISLIDLVVNDKRIYKNKFNGFPYPPVYNNLFIKKVNKYYFEKLNQRVIIINNLLSKEAIKHNIKIIDDFELFCDLKLNYCNALTNSGRKIFFDNSHLTRIGGVYIYSNIIKKYGLSYLGF